MPKVVSQEQIFSAVIELLIKKGYAGTTTKEIAQLASINEVTLFRKYGNKAQLIIKAMESQGIHKTLEDKIKFSGNIDEDIFAIVTGYVVMVQEHGELFPIILSEMARYHELRDALRAPVSLMTKIGELLARYQEMGILKKEDPMSFVTRLLGPLIVNSMIRRANPDLSLQSIDFKSSCRLFFKWSQKTRSHLINDVAAAFSFSKNGRYCLHQRLRRLRA